MEWLQQNWVGLVQAVGALIGAAVLIAALTPTKKDDEVVLRIKTWYDKFFRK